MPKVFTFLLPQDQYEFKLNKTGNVRIMQYGDAFAKPPLPCKNNKYYLFWVCVCVCVCVCVYQHAQRMHRILSAACLVLTYFFHIISFFGKKLLNMKCVLIFSTTFIWNFLILRRIERAVIINVSTSSSNVSVTFATF
jgi:hypothetical protein